MATQSPNGSFALSLRTSSLSSIKIASRQDVLNVFTPAAAISDARRFAGRDTALETMIDALLSEETDIVLFGERGAGKTSLAYMLNQVARGQLEILDYYGLRQRLEKRGRLSWLFGPNRKKFNVIWVDGNGGTLDEVMYQVITRRSDERHGPGLQAYLETEPEKIQVSSKIGFDQILTAEGEVKQVIVPKQPINIKDGFLIASQRYANRYKDEELLIIIDEFDTVNPKTGIAHFLKNLRNVRFLLVGIAQTTLDLLGDHASVARALQTVELAPMTDDELRLILEIGSFILARYCQYTPEAMAEIVRNCHGSPYWCHFLAKTLLEEQMDAAGGFELFSQSPSPRTIGSSDVWRLITSFPTNPKVGNWESALKQITLGSDKLRKVVRGIARSPESVISSATVAAELAADGISEQETLEAIKQILLMTGSPLEERARILDVISFTFRDPNFKRYILMRNAGLPATAA